MNYTLNFMHTNCSSRDVSKLPTLQALRSGLVSVWNGALQHALQLSVAAWIAQLIP